MNNLLLKNAKILHNNKFTFGDILCQDGKIACIAPEINLPEFIDCKGAMLLPGFIDVHTHGGMGIDINAASVEDLLELSKYFASQGTCAYLASVLTDSVERTKQVLQNIKEAMQRESAATLMGAHLEGPFLSLEYKGAMPAELLKEGDIDLIDEYLSSGVVKYITLAPELKGVMDMISHIAPHVVIALGHSSADYDTACKAIDLGASCITHTFNAMRLFHHHEPAIMGAALEKDVYCEAICDGLHLHPGTVRMLLACKGYDNVLAITDCIMASGLPDGEYKLGVNDVTVTNGDARLTETGVRAGSTLSMLRAFKNILKFTGKPIEEIAPLLSRNPAKALGIFDRKGSIDVGKDADMIIIDEELTIHKTIVMGNIVYNKELS